MSKKNWSNILSVLVSTALTFVFVFGQSAWAGQNQNPKDKQDSNGEIKSRQAQANLSTASAAKVQFGEEGAATSQRSLTEGNSQRDGQHEGTKVHGHWTIEVRNPDGGLVTHREFENSLTNGTSSGAASLSLLLSRSVSLGSWSIVLDTLPGFSSPPPCLNGSLPTPCLIHEPGTAFVAANNSVFTLNVSLGPAGTLILSGTVTAGANGGIGMVQTFSSLCANTFAPASPCSTSAQLPQSATFTSATLSTPVVVSAGQTIAVTVNISFS